MMIRKNKNVLEGRSVSYEEFENISHYTFIVRSFRKSSKSV